MLEQHAVVGVPDPLSPPPLRATMLAGVAAAKRGRARTEKAARRENILESEVCELQKTLEGGLLRPTDVCGQPFIRIPLFSDLPPLLCMRGSSRS